MRNSLPVQVVCPDCQAALDADDKYCRHCGAPTGRGDAPGGRGAAWPLGGRSAGGRAAGRPGWWESPWVVLPMLFIVLGPLAIPMLWRSRQFTLLWKIVLTVLTVGITVLVIWEIRLVLEHALAPLRELEKLQRL